MTLSVAEAAPSRLIRVRRAPACDPPYDDERGPDSWLDLPQPQLDLASLTAPPHPPTAGPLRTRGPRAPGMGGPGTGGTGRAGADAPGMGTPGAGVRVPVGAGRTAGDGSPVRAAVRWFLRNWLEILNGYRPLTHVRALASPLDATAVVATTSDAARRFAHLRRRAPGAAGPLRIGRVRICQPSPGVAEVAGVLRDRSQAWALALRLQRHEGRWRCTCVEVLWGNQPTDRRRA